MGKEMGGAELEALMEELGGMTYIPWVLNDKNGSIGTWKDQVITSTGMMLLVLSKSFSTLEMIWSVANTIFNCQNDVSGVTTIVLEENA